MRGSPDAHIGTTLNQLDHRGLSVSALAAHERQVRRDLEILNLPAKSWLQPRRTASGEPILDVAIIGAGMNGIAAAAALIFKGIGNIRIFEASEPGREGPWLTYARMDTLRSPKTLPGPALGIPSLTFRARYEASFGEEAWDRLYKVPNGVWVDYLSWLQHVLALPVSHRTRLRSIAPRDGHLALEITGPEGERVVHARRLVLATGRGGAGGNYVPDFVERDLWPDLAAHTNEEIDFGRLAGRNIAVLGGSASAWDNAATALEKGVASVDMYVRRPALPQINKGRGSASPGFFHGWRALDPAERWALLVYLNDAQAPPPHETVLRALKQQGLKVHLGHAVTAATRTADGVNLAMTSPAGAITREHDFLIVGTGFAVDLGKVPELAAFAPFAARWQDVYHPPEALKRADLAKYPYLGPGFELMPRSPDAPPELSRIHLVNYGAHASHGAIASDVPATSVAGERVALAITDAFFREDTAQIRADLEAFDEPELQDTPFFVPRASHP
jgi:FAD-dependent urate hydroxylase